MTACLWTALALSVARPPAGPVPKVEVAAEASAPAGRIVVLKAETACAVVRWATAADGVDLVPFPDGKTALFCSPTPGRFVVFAWTAAGDVPSDAARCVVVVGGPKPEPKPGPTLAAELQALAAADPTADRGQVLALAGVYREAVKLASLPDVTTAGDLAGRVRAAAQTAVGPNALVPVRTRIAAELAWTLPSDGSAALDAVTRKAAADVFTDIATALEAVR